MHRFVNCMAALLTVLVCGHLHASDKPNFILIMVDDMGYSDIGCFGGEVKTPHLDSLAENGLRFTQFYNTGKCHTTRASLMTGNYEYAVGDNTLSHGATMAEVLKTAGYRTLISGKWHNKPHPMTRGFDRYYGLWDGCSNFFNPGEHAREGEGKPGRKKKSLRKWAIEEKAIMGYTSPDKKFYHTDVFTDYAIDRLEEYKNEDKPFLLYLPYTAPHYPLHAWPSDIAKYRGKYMVGWEVIRKQRFERMKKLGIIGDNHLLTPAEGRSWDSLSDKQKDEEDLKMAVYCAMIDRVDQNLGRLFAKVKELGEWDNTLIMFFSDNGACAEQPNTTPDIAPGPVESYRTVSKEWANASNTPYRKFKSSDYEGGIRTSFIAHWPKVIKPGTMTNQLGHIMDISATYKEIAGATYPEVVNGIKVKPMSGKSLLPILKGEAREGHDRVFWHFGGGRAAREGDLKAVSYGKGKKSKGKKTSSGIVWELYDMSKDPTEMNNLAAQMPEKTEELAKAWEAWLKECGRKGK